MAAARLGRKKRTRTPKLAEFLDQDFLPFIESQFRESTPKTAEYYAYGVKLVLASDLGALKLDEITSQHGGGFIAHNSNLSPSTQNCGLRTLRRALNLACEWAKLERPVKIRMAKGERQRDRVVTEPEFAAYTELCRQPWRDVATLIRLEGMCPGECYELRWEHLNWNGPDESLIRVVKGKTKARRRHLPMHPDVYSMLLGRWGKCGRPAEGWVFPAQSASRHLEESTAKTQHADALKKLRAAHLAYERWLKTANSGVWSQAVAAQVRLNTDFVARHADVIKDGVEKFEPYCLRHTALTRLAESGCDAFTLKQIAGHSSITITQRYCHPQADAIKRAFRTISGGHKIGHNGETRVLLAASAEEATRS